MIFIRNQKHFSFVAAMLLTLAVTMTIAARQDRPSQQAPPAKPGEAEMERLKFYLGEWQYTEEYPKSALFPDGGKNTGIYTSKLGPGGNSLINTFHSQGPMGESEGLLVMTWDAKDKAYKEYFFADQFPGAVVETGTFEGDALVYRLEFTAGGQTMKLRNATRVISPEKIESEQYSSKNDGPETLVVHVSATRKH